jgi:hypothetical protein
MKLLEDARMPQGEWCDCLVGPESCIRFNLLGEYLLRKGESCSRNFFATALSYYTESITSRPLVGAFAVGTLLDLDTLSEDNLPRIWALRILLRALAQFGLDTSQIPVLAAAVRRDESHETLHEIRKVWLAFEKELNPILEGSHSKPLSLVKDLRDYLSWRILRRQAHDIPEGSTSLLKLIQNWGVVETKEMVTDLKDANFCLYREHLTLASAGNDPTLVGVLSYVALGILIELASNAKKYGCLQESPEGARPLVIALDRRKTRAAFRLGNVLFVDNQSGPTDQDRVEGLSLNAGPSLIVADFTPMPEIGSARIGSAGWTVLRSYVESLGGKARHAALCFIPCENFIQLAKCAWTVDGKEVAYLGLLDRLRKAAVFVFPEVADGDT